MANGPSIDELIGSAPATPGQSDQSGFAAYLQNANGAAGNTVIGSAAWPSQVQAYWGLSVLDEPVQQDKTLAPGPDQFGQLPPGVSGPRPPVKSGPYIVPQTKTIQAVLESLVQMSSRERTMLQNRLEKAGYLGKGYKPGAADDQTVNAMGDLLQETARYAMTRDEDVSWQDYLNQRVTAGEKAPKTTTTQASTSITTKESGRGVIYEAFRNAVGRNPSESEIDKFMAHLNAAERAHPTTTTQSVDAQGNSTYNTSGGFDSNAQADMVRQEVQGNDQYAEYQAAAYYMPLLFQSLGGTTNLEGGLQ